MTNIPGAVTDPSRVRGGTLSSRAAATRSRAIWRARLLPVRLVFPEIVVIDEALGSSSTFATLPGALPISAITRSRRTFIPAPAGRPIRTTSTRSFR